MLEMYICNVMLTMVMTIKILGKKVNKHNSHVSIQGLHPSEDVVYVVQKGYLAFTVYVGYKGPIKMNQDILGQGGFLLCFTSCSHPYCSITQSRFCRTATGEPRSCGKKQANVNLYRYLFDSVKIMVKTQYLL